MEVSKKFRRHIHSSLHMLAEREIGHQFLTDSLMARYYKHIQLTLRHTESYGGVFNIEFSPNGKIMVAACEQCGILMFDPVSRIRVHRLPDAHTDSVNCLCFCDDRIFASGSDDGGIVLWDSRMLCEQVMKLSGHTNWVKSLAFDRATKLLLSSAYDGTVRTWDINSCSDLENTCSTTILENEYVSRMQLSPRSDKLIVSSSFGDLGDAITIFHDLDLNSFPKDLPHDWANPFTECDTCNNTRNVLQRLSSVDEYPDIPLYIPSFQVHPHSCCLVSRYFTRNHTHYTTVHDIQEFVHGRKENKRRLTHYIEESESARGFIKEQSFSCDGRVIASPFAHGTRLLAFGSDCCDWYKSRREGSTNFTELKCLLGGHSMPVCCSKFSPIHMLVATGCLGGNVAFHEPKL